MRIVTFSARAEFPDRLTAHIKALVSAPTAQATEGSTPDDAIEHLKHILDFEIQTFQSDLTRVLLEERPALSLRRSETTQDASDTELEGDELDPLLEAFETARGRTLSVLNDLTDDQWARTGRFDDCEMSVLGLVHSLCAHDFESLAMIHLSLARCGDL
ncbi:DinB family protein [Asticcacaulis sp. 201]|uniref:DinB family protein n=1 Tax=Asticcacaulis sp. 201 TaxID=3028787 RepID=UPI002915FBD6|nr:DinB family protein [Asticcacaulis sp. 201]MDV6331166.1 DinB family protein [Asticcacaulis sp. 201]